MKLTMAYLAETSAQRSVQLRRKSVQYCKTLKSTCVVNFPGNLALILWIAGFVLMLLLTIKYFVPLMQDYKYNNYMAQMDIKTGPVPPNVTICLPYYSSYFWTILADARALTHAHLNGSKNMSDVCRLCPILQNQSLDFWNQVNASQDEAVFKFFSEQLLEKHMETPVNESNYEWLQPMIDSMWYYIRIVVEKDLRVLGSGEPEDVAYLGSSFGLHFTNDVMNKLHKYLLRTVADSVHGKCTFKNSDTTNSSSVMHEIVAMPSFSILGEKFCFPIPKVLENQEYECWFQHRIYPWHQYEGRAIEIYPSQSALYAPSTKKGAVYLTNSSIWTDAENVTLSYDVDSRLIAKKSDKDSCASEYESDICVIKRQVAAAVELCGCIPFRYKYLAPANTTTQSLPYCNGTHYARCQDEVKRHLRFSQSHCSRSTKCEYTFYDWPSATVYTKFGQHTQSETLYKVTLTSSLKPYIEFSVQEKFTTEQFLSDVGGLANFYLGFSGMTIIAIIILCIEQGKYWYKLRSTPSRAEDGLGTSSAWQFIRTLAIFHMMGTRGVDDGHREEARRAEVDELKMIVEAMKTEYELKLEELRMEIRALKVGEETKL